MTSSSLPAFSRCAILDFAGKAKFFRRLNIPKDPNIVYFGAEVGWEASLVQSLFGDGGRILLIDNDPHAYARFQNAPNVASYRSGPFGKTAEVRRNLERIEYAQKDFFEYSAEPIFDVGIDWGLLEHFSDENKKRVLERFRAFLKPGALQISSTPRDSALVRLFYYAFAEELNFGYRELMKLDELKRVFSSSNWMIEDEYEMTAHNVLAVRPPLKT